MSKDDHSNFCLIEFKVLFKDLSSIKADLNREFLDPSNSILLGILLYNSVILPIITYGSEIWLTDFNLNLDTLDKLPFEKVQNMIFKNILGVHGKASNLA
jgi:hypothetical protein